MSFAGATGGRSRTPTGGPAAAVVTRQRTVKVATVDSSALFDSSVEAEAEELEGGRYAPVDFVDAELSLELRREAVEAAAAATRLVKKEEEDGEEKEERLGQRLQAVELGCEASDPVNVFSKEKREKEMVFFQFPTVLPTTVGQEGKKEEDGCSEIEDRRGLLEKLPSGQIGTMRRWKSGKVTMRIGEVEFLVSGGTPYPFEQQVVALEYDKGNTPAESSGSLKFLGSLKHRFVCSVDVNSL